MSSSTHLRCLTDRELPLGQPGSLGATMRPPTFGHGPGADISRHAAPLLWGVLVASLQLDAVASEVTQPRDDQGFLVHHFLEGLVLLRARGCAGGGVGETRNRGRGRRHIGNVTEGPAFPRWPVMKAGHTWSRDRRLLRQKRCWGIKGSKIKDWCGGDARRHTD